MESAVGNERASASSVTRTAGAPVALPVYKNFSVFSFPDSINPFFRIFCVASVYISLTSLCISSRSLSSPFLSVPLSRSSLRSVCGGKWNHGFINKTKDIHFEASALPMSSARNIKTVMYKSAWHSVRKYRWTGSSEEEPPWIQMFSSLHITESRGIE